MVKNFQDLKVWQKAHQLTLDIYKITENFPKHEIYGLVSQIRRAVVSIVSNIVEGFRRRFLKDSLHFYNIANSSLEEVRYQLLLARDLKYINDQEYQNISNLAEEVSKMLNAWIKNQN